MEDEFEGCDEDAARTESSYGLFEWERRVEFTPGRWVTLMLDWSPEDGVLLAEVVRLARISLERLRRDEESHRRAAVAELNGPRRWFPVNADDLFPYAVYFPHDGSADVIYGGIETGGHQFVVEVSPEGRYVTYRID